MLTAPRISKRKYQQHGTPANQKLGHKLRGKTIARQQAESEALYVDQARAAEIGINPKYRNSQSGLMISAETWNVKAAQWNADHDVATPLKVEPRTSKRRRKTPRAAATYRAERRNAAKLAAKAQRARAPALPLAA